MEVRKERRPQSRHPEVRGSCMQPLKELSRGASWNVKWEEARERGRKCSRRGGGRRQRVERKEEKEPNNELGHEHRGVNRPGRCRKSLRRGDVHRTDDDGNAVPGLGTPPDSWSQFHPPSEPKFQQCRGPCCVPWARLMAETSFVRPGLTSLSSLGF